MFGPAEEQPRRLRVKICGICHEEDAWAAVDAGADAIGLNGWPGSRRYLDIAAAGEWIGKLPASLRRVAVLVNPTWEEALALGRLPFVDGLQLHGMETPEFCARLAAAGVQFAKALPVRDEHSLAALPDYSTEIFVLDSHAPGVFGGTGRVFPWEIARRFVAENPAHRVILAGGLAPENVAAAVRATRPFGVDVTSGVEASAGRKDHARVRAFVAAARAAAAEI